jgi:prophage DNA circulation protein
VPFRVDVDAKAGGRRIAMHEFPKRDTPWAEDMGRRARRFAITAYIIFSPLEPDFEARRDALEAQLDIEGAGQLVHPTRGTSRVVVDTYSMTERRERGGIAEFDIVFLEAGQKISTNVGTDTQGEVNSSADNVIGVSTDSATQ